MFRYWDPEMSLVALFDAKFKGLTHNITRKISLVNLNHTIFLILGGFNPPSAKCLGEPPSPPASYASGPDRNTLRFFNESENIYNYCVSILNIGGGGRWGDEKTLKNYFCDSVV
jgi:hypothetical protein